MTEHDWLDVNSFSVSKSSIKKTTIDCLPFDLRSNSMVQKTVLNNLDLLIGIGPNPFLDFSRKPLALPTSYDSVSSIFLKTKLENIARNLRLNEFTEANKSLFLLNGMAHKVTHR